MNWYLFMAELIQYVPTSLGRMIRRFYYRMFLVNVGRGTSFHVGSIVTDRMTEIGNNSRIGPGNTIGLVKIGNDVLLAQNVHVLSGRHQHTKGNKLKRVVIGDGVWVGANSVIMSDLGKESIVGAGSVVVKPVKDNEKVAGNPARMI